MCVFDAEQWRKHVIMCVPMCVLKEDNVLYEHVSEHNPRMESCEEISECLWENYKSLVTSVSSKHGIVLGLCFCAVPRYWTGVSSLQVSHYNCCFLFMRLYGKTRLHQVQLALRIVHFTYVTPLNPQSASCLTRRRKWAIAQVFNLPHLWAPFSQIPPPGK